MNRSEIYAFISAHRWAVQASVTESGAPQAAVIGMAATNKLELVFDTLKSSRKYANIRRNPKMALVIGWDEARTLQYEGLADEPEGAELERLQSRYFEIFPDGRERLTWEGLTYIRVKPVWLRFSDFNMVPPQIVELQGADI